MNRLPLVRDDEEDELADDLNDDPAALLDFFTIFLNTIVELLPVEVGI